MQETAAEFKVVQHAWPKVIESGLYATYDGAGVGLVKVGV